MKKLFIFLLVCQVTHAELDENVLIRGKIGNSFDKKMVKVIDDLNQSYFLPRKFFPENFKFHPGTSFSIEVPEKEINKIEIKKK